MRWIVLCLLLFAGCEVDCESGLFADGKCCGYVCDKECANGYVEGTCNCECVEDEPVAIDDTNVDSVFDDSDIAPPPIPN